jgi:hypothetical protein
MSSYQRNAVRAFFWGGGGREFNTIKQKSTTVSANTEIEFNKTVVRKEKGKNPTKQVGETLSQANLAHTPEIIGRHPPIREALHQHLTTKQLK